MRDGERRRGSRAAFLPHTEKRLSFSLFFPSGEAGDKTPTENQNQENWNLGASNATEIDRVMPEPKGSLDESILGKTPRGLKSR